MRELGIVTKIKEGILTVRIAAAEGCSSCSGCSSSNTHNDCSIAGKELQADAAADNDISVGDRVELYVPDSAGAAGALWLIFVPICLFFVAYLGLGYLIPGSGDGLKAISGLAGIAVGLLFGATVAKKGRMSHRPVARLV
ncbi:hypothetical protein MASR2M29_24170 [Spirochaetota bacterium]